MNNFNIKMFVEGRGDCFLLKISNNTSSANILIDGYSKLSNELKENLNINDDLGCLKNQINSIDYIDHIDYIVVTHIDSDHVKGIIDLFEDSKYNPKIKNTSIIYNFVTKKTIDYRHAQKLEKLINGKKIINTCENDYTIYSNDFIKFLSYEKRKKLSPRNKDVAYITFLHPNEKKDVNEVYEDYKSKNRTGDFKPNGELVNKQSISFLIEFLDKKVLFTGDGDMDTISAKIDNLRNIHNKEIDFIKIPHHGAEKQNKGLADFIKKYKTTSLIVSGTKKWNRKHPAESILKEIDKLELKSESEKKIKIYTNSILDSFDKFQNIDFINGENISLL